MVTKDILARAKSFLCWDKFKELNIQLIEVEAPVSYFFAPNDERASVVVFLKSRDGDHGESLCLLFHEVGHFMQYTEAKDSATLAQYWRQVDEVSGPAKAEFERRAWELGRGVLEEFLRQEIGFSAELLSWFDALAQRSIKTYS